MLFFKVLVGVIPRGKPVISVYRVQEVVREGCSIHVHGGYWLSAIDGTGWPTPLLR